jgi:hypothetical protein
MSRQNIAVGSAANDGTGDTLRAAGNKLNSNFVELYKKLGGDSNTLSGQLSVAADGLVFEGTTTDSNETTLKVRDPNTDQEIFLPNASGEVILDSSSQTLTNKTLSSPILTTPKINDLSANHTYDLVAGELSADRNINLPVLSDSDTFVFAGTTQTITNKTLDSATLNDVALNGNILDINGANLLNVTAIASSVNEVGIVNAATGNAPTINATGTDADVSLSIQTQGTGAVINKKVAVSSATQTASGVMSALAGYIIFNSGGAVAATLNNGTVVGEMKMITNKGAGLVTVTAASFAGGGTFTVATNTGAQLIWDGTNWFKF